MWYMADVLADPRVPVAVAYDDPSRREPEAMGREARERYAYAVRHAERFDVTGIVAFYDAQQGGKNLMDFPLLRLPFTDCWAEAIHPKGMGIAALANEEELDDGWRGYLDNVQLGDSEHGPALVQTRQHINDYAQVVLRLTPFITQRDRVLRAWAVDYLVFVTREGRFCGQIIASHLPEAVYANNVLASVTEVLKGLLYGLTFSNVKGAVVSDPAPRPPVSPHAKHRDRSQRYRYRVITIPGTSFDSAIPGRAVPSHERAEHAVRGHPVTYHEDAPLFGKLVGTYWRRDHIRGNAERGRIDKDYVVEPPTE